MLSPHNLETMWKQALTIWKVAPEYELHNGENRVNTAIVDFWLYGWTFPQPNGSVVAYRLKNALQIEAHDMPSSTRYNLNLKFPRTTLRFNASQKLNKL